VKVRSCDPKHTKKPPSQNYVISLTYCHFTISLSLIARSVV